MAYLGSINVSQSEHANTLTAITGLPVSVTYTHIVRSTFAVAIASIGALTIDDGSVSSKDGCYQNRFLKHDTVFSLIQLTIMNSFTAI